MRVKFVHQGSHEVERWVDVRRWRVSDDCPTTWLTAHDFLMGQKSKEHCYMLHQTGTYETADGKGPNPATKYIFSHRTKLETKIPRLPEPVTQQPATQQQVNPTT